MRQFILQHKWFYALWLSFIILGSSYFFLFDKGDFSLYFNCHKHFCLDFFFKSSTRLAEFYVSLVVVLLLFFYRISYGVFYLLNAAVISLIVNFLKHQIFKAPRPALYFKPYFDLDPVHGVSLLQQYSFPSGHSTFAFGSMLVLAIAIKNKWVSIICFILALSTAISRIYLLEHFYEDIYAGAILGVIITTVNYSWTKNWLQESNRPWLQYSLFHQLFKKEKY
jgi:membrane-associated phospholipid phosphatase